MKALKSLVLFASVLAIAVSCGHNKLKYNDDALTKNTQSGPALAARVVWVKNKKETLDVLLKLTNEYPNSISILDSGFTMSFGGVKVEPRNRTGGLELGPGVTSEKLVIFDFGSSKPEAGMAVLAIAGQNSNATSKDEGKLPVLTVQLPVEKR